MYKYCHHQFINVQKYHKISDVVSTAGSPGFNYSKRIEQISTYSEVAPDLRNPKKFPIGISEVIVLMLVTHNA